MLGWIWCGLPKGALFYVWQCAKCGIRRSAIAMRLDGKCPVCLKAKRRRAA